MLESELFVLVSEGKAASQNANSQPFCANIVKSLATQLVEQDVEKPKNGFKNPANHEPLGSKCQN